MREKSQHLQKLGTPNYRNRISESIREQLSKSIWGVVGDERHTFLNFSLVDCNRCSIKLSTWSLSRFHSNQHANEYDKISSDM